MISEFDIEELVRGMGCLGDEVDVYDYVQEEYSMDWDNFCTLIRALMPFVVVGRSPITNKIYKGFGKNGVFFIKQEMEK